MEAATNSERIHFYSMKFKHLLNININIIIILKKISKNLKI